MSCQISASSSGAFMPCKSNQGPLSFSSLYKASVGSVDSTSSVAPSEPQHCSTAPFPPKGFKMLAPKMSFLSACSSTSYSIHQGNNSPSSSQQLSAPSPVPSTDKAKRNSTVKARRNLPILTVLQIILVMMIEEGTILLSITIIWLAYH